jgi:phosphoribosylformylglycinamidine synthase subunit PurL
LEKTEIEISAGVAEELGLTQQEFEKILEIMGGKLNFTELAIFSAMWSEHCSYKNSINWLKKLPRKSEKMLVEAGEENAGLIDIGGGLACSFKIESHNHPSALEPYQGAATGVGGINRDIFTMGARPICQLNSLRFGDPKEKKTKWLLEGVVKGIGDYGNAFGVPTVGGEVFFDECFNVNPLVNAFSAGIVEKGKTISAISKGVGNPVFIVGSRTGKDGIHGASFASKDITEDSVNDLPAVQVGDPFQEKLLLEATLEVIETGFIIGMQDMGAAGIICSTSEMSEKGDHGMEIWLDRVPTRQENMKPYEILLSESQERMLVVVEKGREKEINEVFIKWDLSCEQIGVVTEGPDLKFFENGEIVAKVPAWHLVLGGGAPVYEREYKEPAYFQRFKNFRISDVEEPENLAEIGNFLLTHPNIASKKWVFEQYDSMVGTNFMNTADRSDAGVVRIKGTNKALAVTVDCNSRYVKNDPEVGCTMAVAEAARNIICSGGEPLGITNCLNFGNPYNPEVYWQFVKSIEGMKKACEAFNTPVTGGNVSFYNQSSDEGPVFPSPVIGMLGILENRELLTTLSFKKEGDIIFLIGESKEDISGSEYLNSFHGIKESPAPYFNLDEELEVQAFTGRVIRKGMVNSAHDLSEGGLFIALLESAMAGMLGFRVDISTSIRKDAYLFGEGGGRILFSVPAEMEEKFVEEILKAKISHQRLGEVEGGICVFDKENWGTIDDLKDKYQNAFESILK